MLTVRVERAEDVAIVNVAGRIVRGQESTFDISSLNHALAVLGNCECNAMPAHAAA